MLITELFTPTKTVYTEVAQLRSIFILLTLIIMKCQIFNSTFEGEDPLK